MDVGAFQVRGVRSPLVPSCDYLIRRRRKGIAESTGLETIVLLVRRREDRGVDSMLPNHKRDCIESATGVSSGLPRAATFRKLVRALFFLFALLSSLSHEVGPC